MESFFRFQIEKKIVIIWKHFVSINRNDRLCAMIEMMFSSSSFFSLVLENHRFRDDGGGIVHAVVVMWMRSKAKMIVFLHHQDVLLFRVWTPVASSVNASGWFGCFFFLLLRRRRLFRNYISLSSLCRIYKRHMSLCNALNIRSLLFFSYIQFDYTTIMEVVKRSMVTTALWVLFICLSMLLTIRWIESWNPTRRNRLLFSLSQYKYEQTSVFFLQFSTEQR